MFILLYIVVSTQEINTIVHMIKRPENGHKIVYRLFGRFELSTAFFQWLAHKDANNALINQKSIFILF